MSACVIFPFGWSDSRVKETCKSTVYNRGTCEISWAFILAVIHSMICIVSSLLVYTLASKKSVFQDSDLFIKDVRSIFALTEQKINPKRTEGNIFILNF